MHPSEKNLALFAGGDVDVLERWQIKRHLSGCEKCAREVESFQAASNGLARESGSLPSGLNWDRLAAEMTANIHLGLEAGECVAPARLRPERFGWRAVAVMAAMTGVLLTAWIWNPTDRPQPGLHGSRVELRSTAGGIELNDNGHALTLLHTRGRQKPIIVSAPGTLRARYVDSETGQITINNVYTE